MPTAEQLSRLLAYHEALASRELDGETMHVAAPDGGCCLDHARERIAELEAEKGLIVAELTALREQVTWIPTDVRMPTVNERVLGVYRFKYDGCQQWAVFLWHPESGWWDWALDEPLGDDCEMVYWRPVPRLPEAEEATNDDATE